MMTNEERIEKAIDLGVQYGQTDGSHHKTRVIDLEELKRLAEAATPGPSELQFIAAANPQAILAILERIRHLESANSGLRKILKIYESGDPDD